MKQARPDEEQIIGIVGNYEAGRKNRRLSGKYGISEQTLYSRPKPIPTERMAMISALMLPPKTTGEGGFQRLRSVNISRRRQATSVL